MKWIHIFRDKGLSDAKLNEQSLFPKTRIQVTHLTHEHLYTYTTINPVNFVDPTGHYHVDPDGNKVLRSGKVIKNPSQPGPSNYGTPSGVSKSKPSTKKISGSSVKKLIQTGLDYGGYIPGPLRSSS